MVHKCSCKRRLPLAAERDLQAFSHPRAGGTSRARHPRNRAGVYQYDACLSFPEAAVTDTLDIHAISAYLEGVLPPRHEVLREMEARARASRFPIVGPAVGHLLYLVTRLGGARRVFELGSGFGYSTAWFAMGVRDNGGGEVTHVVWDEALSNDARGYLRRLGLEEFVRYHVGEAVAQLRRADGPFDIIFNDIEKDGYPAALPVIKEHLARGGLLVSDNMLWSGRVLNSRARDAATAGVREFTRAVFADPDFSAVIVPLRDGVLLARKR